MPFSLFHLPSPSSPLPLPSPIRFLQNPILPATVLHTYLNFSYRNSEFLPKAASIGGSTAEFPEELAGDAGIRPRRRRTVAGVDQEELLDPDKLADPDSFFWEFNGVPIHHKICRHDEEDEEVKESPFQLPMILLHGFGASVFSWHRVMKPLAQLTGSKVLAFDRPAFGLTSRVSTIGHPRPLNPYSMAFSVLATLSFIDLLGAGKAILMGHSAGCLVAVNTYFEAPNRVAALILVAPAIFAPLMPQKGVKETEAGGDNQEGDGNSDINAEENPFVRVWKAVYKLCMVFIGMALSLLKGMRAMVGSLYTTALSAILRSSLAVMLVRMIIDKFGIPAIRNAWFDASQITDHVLQGYTKPLRARGWEMALLEYTLAMITDSERKAPLSRRLAEISCPVLIVTGDTDRLVPSWNAERLSRAIPGSTIEVIKNCGHLPHEERVDEFLSVVGRFLQRAFGSPKKQFFPAAA